MLGKVAITEGGAGGQVTILTSLSHVPSNPPPSASALTDVGCIDLVRMSGIKIKMKRAVESLAVNPSKRRRAKSLFLSADIDVGIR